jgi:6-phospho-beta-glucosidase
MISFWTRYVEVIFNRFKGKIKYYLTFNEINNLFRIPFAAGAVLKIHPQDTSKPNADLTDADLYQAAHHIFIANAKTVQCCKKIDTEAKIGCMMSLSSLATYPYTCDPDDVMGTLSFQRQHHFFMEVMCHGHYPNYIKRIWEEKDINMNITEEERILLEKNTVDFIAFSYYRSAVYQVGAKLRVDTGGTAGIDNPYLSGCSPEPWSWPIDPKGIRYVCNVLNDYYHLPLFIVENGIGLDENLDDNNEIQDDFRIQYTKDHLLQLHEAMQDGCDIMGYLYWGPIDIVSAGTGEMRKRYGFVHVDLDNEGKGTLARTKKKSYNWYKEVICSNGAKLFE